MLDTGKSQLLEIAQGQGVFTASEAVASGIHSQQLTRLVATGVLERISRGHYRLADGPLTEHHGLAVAAAAAPTGVICLLSALDFHGIGTQLPADVWIALERGTRPPKLAYPPLRVVQFSGAAFTEGVESHRIEGREVSVYSVAKTVADCFKYRNKIGLDVALEALHEAWRDRRCTVDDLDRAARACRVVRVMRPYVEMAVA